MGLSLAPPLPLARQHSVQPPHLANGRPLSHELLQLGEPPAPTASLHAALNGEALQATAMRFYPTAKRFWTSRFLHYLAIQFAAITNQSNSGASSRI